MHRTDGYSTDAGGGGALWGSSTSVSSVSEGRAGDSGWKVEEEGEGIKQSPGKGTRMGFGGTLGQRESHLSLMVMNSK